jgi:hypothetical protein
MTDRQVGKTEMNLPLARCHGSKVTNRLEFHLDVDSAVPVTLPLITSAQLMAAAARTWGWGNRGSAAVALGLGGTNNLLAPIPEHATSPTCCC